MPHTFNPNSANPFQVNNTHKEWTGNNLILKDPKLRELAGVNVLDSDVADIVNMPLQNGGVSVGVPHHIMRFGAKDSVNTHLNQVSKELEDLKIKGAQVPVTKQSGGGRLPYHYFNNNLQW